jgi:hypothetical protein
MQYGTKYFMSRFARTLFICLPFPWMADPSFSDHDRCPLGACGTVLWIMLSVLGHLHEEPRVAQQQAGLRVVAVSMPVGGTSGAERGRP